MKAFEDATGKPLDEDKKELASEELITTGDLGDDIGQDKATGIVNDVKTEIIKNNTKDTVQIAETINNVVNNYNVTLTDEQMSKLESLMEKIAQQDYKYSEMKDALNSVSDVVSENLSAMGEKVNTGFFDGILDGIKNFFTGIGDWFKETFGGENNDSSILDNTNDSLLGENAQIDATDKSTINLPSSEEVEGFFAKIWHWFTGLFTNNSDNVEDNINNENTTTPQEELNNDTVNDESVNSLEENSTVEENVQPETSTDTNIGSQEDTNSSVDEQTTKDNDSDNNNESLDTTDSQSDTNQ